MKISLLAYTNSPEIISVFDKVNKSSPVAVVNFVSIIQELFEKASHQPYDAVFIDASTRELPLGLITNDLMEQNPEVKIMLLSPAEEFEEEELEEVAHHALLTAPLLAEELEASLLVLFSDRFTLLDAESGADETSAQQNDPPSNDTELSLIEIIDAADFDAMPAGMMPPAVEPSGEPDITSAVVAAMDEASPTSKVGVATAPDISALRFGYCCVLIPRYAKQYLTRDIADRLAAILPRIHLSRGWRVTGISVRPQYLQWFVLLPAETCPVEAIQEIRRRTSAYLIDQFPELAGASQNPDFWTAGYLMMSGEQPISMNIIRQFIENTRFPSPGDR